jgi:atypical dual specificity phosphatase
MVPHVFYWVIEGALAGYARPGGPHGPYAGANGHAGAPAEGEAALDADLAWLRAEGIGAVLSLTETSPPPEALARHGLAHLHLPVDDLRAPSPGQLEEALRFLDRQRGQGRAVAVHCRMGQGRTGTVLAAYLIRGGLGAGAAIAELRRVCPGAIGSRDQEAALAAFAGRRDWLL